MENYSKQKFLTPLSTYVEEVRSSLLDYAKLDLFLEYQPQPIYGLLSTNAGFGSPFFGGGPGGSVTINTCRDVPLPLLL